ncbi:MAG: hypothetical protein QM773_01505 [Hyphomonadaceae bacterium]
MSQVRKFMPENKLAKTITDPAGMLVKQAVQNASANIEAVRDEHIAALDVKMDELAAVSAKAMQTQGSDDASQVYRLAREILADAGMFGLKHISRAAHSLCELMAAGDRYRHQWAGVAVHIEAISILRKGGGAFGGTDVDTMLAGLEKISRSAV